MARVSEATRRFIELAKIEGNAEIIREELRAIQEGRELGSVEIPCPFVSSLLAIAFGPSPGTFDQFMDNALDMESGESVPYCYGKYFFNQTWPLKRS